MITIERVMQGYEKSGLKPLKKLWVFKQDDGTKCGCAVTAILVGEGHISFEALRIMRKTVPALEFEKFITEKLESPIEEIWCFIDGFDTHRDVGEDEPEFRKLGKQCQREVFRQ